jgi:predicted ATPase
MTETLPGVSPTSALPGATLWDVGPWGLRLTTFDELELVKHWKAYLDQPMRYLRHVLGHH